MLAIVRDSEVEQWKMLKSNKKLARIRHILESQPFQYEESLLDEILELDGNINYQMPDSGDAALHFAMKAAAAGWLSYGKKKLIPSKLIAAGADPTIANREGQTPVHVAAVDFKNPVQRFIKSPHTRDMLPIVHLRNGNTTNFKDIHGFSHFHTACMIDNAEIMEFFLNNGVSVDETVNADAPEFSGYTSLHFAVEFGSLDLVDKLLDNGAKLTKDSSGMSPLHMLIRRNMEIIQRVSLYRIEVYDYPEKGIVVNEETVLAELEANEKMIASIVSKRGKTVMMGVDLLPFYVMQTLKDASSNWTPNDVNERIPVDSVCWPGYSALHFAARFDTGTVKLLLEKGADIEAKDADGVTPLDLCVGRYSIEYIHSIISSQKIWKNILLTDDKTKLLDLVFTMRDPERLTKFLSERDINGISIPRDSSLWPGFTILHLAVSLSKKRMRGRVGCYAKLLDDDPKRKRPNELVKVCLRSGADVLAKDGSGSTPIHLAFRRMDLDAMYQLIEIYDGKSNPTDEDNLSLLHIACALEKVTLVKKLLASGADPNAAVSSTFQWDPEVRYFHELSSSDEHLHVWPGSTPLHVAEAMCNKAVFELLLESGADLKAKDIHGLTPVHRLLVVHESYENITEYEDLLLRFVTNDCVIEGLSYLHVAAHRGYPKLLEKLLSLGADANSTVVARDERVSMASLDRFSYRFARVKRKTKFSFYLNYFKGDTPLHVAFHYTCTKDNISRTLMSSGADVLANNWRDVSPICVVLKHKGLLRHYLSVMSLKEEKRLFDEMGLTRLHMACQLRDEQIIRHCLKKGADVNARVRDDSEIWPGYTPLHVVVGSDYNSYDFKAKMRPFKKKTMCRIVRMLLKAGADVMIADAMGRTPLMTNIRENHVNDSSRPTHMDILWRQLKDRDLNPLSNQGLSHFHLACLRKDVDLVERFLKLGVDPNQTVDYLSDQFPGYTPLHFAVKCYSNCLVRSDSPPLRTVDLLLKYGANVNAVDENENTPLHFAATYPSLGALPYKRLFWAGADPEAKNSFGKAPSANRMFNVENGEVRQFYRECFLLGRRYLLRQLANPFICCNRYIHRVLLFFYEFMNVEKK